MRTRTLFVLWVFISQSRRRRGTLISYLMLGIFCISALVILILGISLLQSAIAQSTSATGLYGKTEDLKMPSWITHPQEFGEKIRAVNPESRFAIIGQQTDLAPVVMSLK